MEDFDEEAEKQINAEYGSDSDSYAMLDAFVRKPDNGTKVAEPLFSMV